LVNNHLRPIPQAKPKVVYYLTFIQSIHHRALCLFYLWKLERCSHRHDPSNTLEYLVLIHKTTSQKVYMAWVYYLSHGFYYKRRHRPSIRFAAPVKT